MNFSAIRTTSEPMRLHRAVLYAVTMLLVFTPTSAHAAITSADVAALGADDYQTRHETTRKLLADESLTPQQIAQVFSSATKVEQKHRLLSLARHHLLRLTRQRDYPISATAALQGMPGALGLTHGPVTSDELPQLKQSAVRVRRTLPGFPAHAALEAGDLILQVAGNEIPAGLSSDRISNHFGDAIRMIAAGKSVELKIQRDGKVIDVKVTLAPLDALSGMYRPELRSDYERAWNKFREALVTTEK